MKKKTFIVSIVFVLIICLLPLTAYASHRAIANKAAVSITPTISISGKTVTYGASARFSIPSSGTITVYLEERLNTSSGSWTRVATASKPFTSSLAPSISATYTGRSGYSYRTYAVATDRTGSSVNGYSAVKSIP